MSGKSQGILKWMISGNPVTANTALNSLALFSTPPGIIDLRVKVTNFIY